MASLTVEIPDDVLEAFRQRAARSGRSLNDEVLLALDGLASRKILGPEAFLERVRHRRERMNVQELTPEAVRQAREEGRA